MNFIREKKIYCGDFLEVDIYPCSGVRAKKRGKKKKLTLPKQARSNEKKAKRRLAQYIKTNFGRRDIHVTVTYNDKFLPESVEAAEKEARNYIRRINHRRKKKELDPIKYILITEFRTQGDEPVRIHHHIIMNGGLDRDEVESLWSKKNESMGFANADRIQTDHEGLEKLSSYLMKAPYGKKRWSTSQNLKKPEEKISDYKYTRRQVMKYAKDDMSIWEKRYKGWTINRENGLRAEYNEENGWSIYLKFEKRKGDKDDTDIHIRDM